MRLDHPFQDAAGVVIDDIGVLRAALRDAKRQLAAQEERMNRIIGTQRDIASAALDLQRY